MARDVGKAVSMPALALISTQTATSYAFRATGTAHGWANCTVNDATGDLHISSDWGSWSHRWDPRPSSLGERNLTEFIGARGNVDYLARKLQPDGHGRRFSATATAGALRRWLCARRLSDGRCQLEHQLEPDDYDGGRLPSHLMGRYTETGLPLFSAIRVRSPTWNDPGREEALPYLTREKAREIWAAIGHLADDVGYPGGGGSADFYARVQQIDGFTDYVTAEPWEHHSTEQTSEDKALREIVLPALIAACRAASASGPLPAPDRRAELVERIAKNKAWLSYNYHQSKHVRRSCQANLEADEQELARLDADRSAP